MSRASTCCYICYGLALLCMVMGKTEAGFPYVAAGLVIAALKPKKEGEERK